MPTKDKRMKFQSMTLDRRLSDALNASGLTHATPMQFNALQYTTQDMADVLIHTPTSQSGAGRLMLLAIMGVHCLLTEKEERPHRTVLLLVHDKSCYTKIKPYLQRMLFATHIGPVADCYLWVDVGVTRASLMSAKCHNAFFVGTVQAFAKWKPKDMKDVITVLAEDVSKYTAEELEPVIQKNILASAPSANLFWLTRVSPVLLPYQLRHLLRRRSRRFYFNPQHKALLPGMTNLLAINPNEPQKLCRRIAMMPGAKRILVFTHNKEISELHMKIVQWLEKRNGQVFMINRTLNIHQQDELCLKYLKACAALTEESGICVLVTTDLFTGVDLCDVDLIIRMHPPQKSLSKMEWDELMMYYRMTNNPQKLTRVVTIVRTDEFPFLINLNGKINKTLPLLSLHPQHEQFDQIVRFPEKTLSAKRHMQDKIAQKGGREWNTPADSVASSKMAASSAPLATNRSAPASQGQARAATGKDSGKNVSEKEKSVASPWETEGLGRGLASSAATVANGAAASNGKGSKGDQQGRQETLEGVAPGGLKYPMPRSKQQQQQQQQQAAAQGKVPPAASKAQSANTNAGKGSVNPTGHKK